MTELAKQFETKVRDSGKSYVSLRDERPDWLHDAVRDAHEDEPPDDWRYETCQSICYLIDDGITEASEIADSLADIYTSDLIAWLGTHWCRRGWVDNARADGLIEPDADLETQLRIGQYCCIESMASIFLQAVQDNEEEEEE